MPVTGVAMRAIDLEARALIHEVVLKHFPDHGFVGEIAGFHQRQLRIAVQRMPFGIPGVAIRHAAMRAGGDELRDHGVAECAGAAGDDDGAAAEIVHRLAFRV